MHAQVIRLNEVKAMSGLSRTTIYAWMKSGEFPQSIALGARSVGWVKEEIDNWIKDRMAARTTTKP